MPQDLAVGRFEGAPVTWAVDAARLLADELATIRAWLPSIQSSPYPAIAALAPQLMAVLAVADKAVANSLATKQALKDFDAI